VADRVTGPEARVVVARDGAIRSAELVTSSGDPALDKSVERALRAVTKLPPFPAGAQEEERTFRIRLNLDAKKASG
jgi:TonB family protein